MDLKPMTKATEKKGKPAPKKGGIKLGTSIKTATVKNLNSSFITWDDMQDGNSIVFELNGEFQTSVSEKNSNHVFENYYTWKAVVVDSEENVIKVLEAKDGDNLIQIPCQQSHRNGIKDLLEMDENVCIYRDLKVNVSKTGQTYNNCNVGSLDLESLDAYEA